MTLTPAYGKDYNSQREVLEAFNAGKDFVINDISSPHDGRYVNKPQLIETNIDRVTIRYKQLRSVMSVKVTAK
jgi:hypothetical protein